MQIPQLNVKSAKKYQDLYTVHQKKVKLQCDFTKLDLFRVEFLDSVSQHTFQLAHFAAIDIRNEIFYTNKLPTLPGRMLLIRKVSIKNKYQNGSLTSSDAPKKLVQKWYFFTVGKPIEIDCRSRIVRSSLREALQRVRMCDFRANFF